MHRSASTGRAPRPLPVRRLLVALTLLASACTSGRDAQGHEVADSGQECATFTYDPDQPFTEVSQTYVDRDPLELPLADPVEVGLDPVGLANAADAVALSPGAASLLVMRDGKLAFERYFNGYDAADANGVHSLSKSILSVLTGIAIEEGRLSLDSTVGDLLPADQVPAHGDLTVRDLITMAGGLEMPAVDLDYEWEPSDVPGEPSLVRAVLERSSVTEPGTEFVYNTGLTQVLGAMVAEATGMSLCDYAAERLFGPLGVDVEHWHVDPTGYFAGGYGLVLTPREIARFGQLIADDGEFDGARLVSTSWLGESLSSRWELGCAAYPAAQSYGYLWWRYDIGGHQAWMASGFGAQDLVIIEDLDLVAVVTHDTTEPGFRVPMLALLYDILLAAVDGQSPPEPHEQCPVAMTMASVATDGSSPPSLIPGWPADALPWSASPGGDRLVLSRRFAGAFDLYTIDRDGSDLTRVTRDGPPDVIPSWSPDGAMVVFARGEPWASDLYLIAPDGTGLRQLTDFDGYEQSATWSPDSRRIAFIWGHDDVVGFGHSGELWVMDSDGTNLEQLVGDGASYPAWSPDGTHIAFGRSGDTDHIMVLDLADDETNDLGSGLLPRWSPDGARIAFVGLRDGDGSDVFTMAADGTDRVRLTDDPEFDTSPLWGSDGATVVFATSAR